MNTKKKVVKYLILANLKSKLKDFKSLLQRKSKKFGVFIVIYKHQVSPSDNIYIRLKIDEYVF